MTASKKGAPAADAATALEQPTQGGSYIRQGDGTLKRVEFTEVAASDAAQDDTAAGPVAGTEEA